MFISATFSEKATLTAPRGTAQAFPWHQDRENYWMWNDVKNYLNFYIPVVKPIVEKSNLTVVPLDRLHSRAPEIHDRLISRGATHACCPRARNGLSEMTTRAAI